MTRDGVPNSAASDCRSPLLLILLFTKFATLSEGSASRLMSAIPSGAENTRKRTLCLPATVDPARLNEDIKFPNQTFIHVIEGRRVTCATALTPAAVIRPDIGSIMTFMPS